MLFILGAAGGYMFLNSVKSLILTDALATIIFINMHTTCIILEWISIEHCMHVACTHVTCMLHTNEKCPKLGQKKTGMFMHVFYLNGSLVSSLWTCMFSAPEIAGRMHVTCMKHSFHFFFLVNTPTAWGTEAVHAGIVFLVWGSLV